MKKRTFSNEFKQEAASLVLDKYYSIRDACDAVGVCESAMRRWVKQLKAERDGHTPISNRAITAEQQRIQELEATIRRIEQEKEILKKATALLMSDRMKSY